MQISVSENNVNFEPVDVSNATEFLEYALSCNWSPSIFRDNYRNLKNFISADFIGVDIDNDEAVTMSLAEAVEAFREYKHLIMPSKSHRKEKNGKIKDRYRVLLFLTRPITEEAEYYATWFSLQTRWPAIDPSCKDPSRFYYPSTECVSKNMKGKTIDPVLPSIDSVVSAQDTISTPILPEIQSFGEGELARKTLKFMLSGARPGNRHRELYKAARDYHQNNFTREKFLSDLQDMITRTGNWNTKKPTAKDIGTIDDAFSKEPKHSARFVYERALLFEPVSEVLNSEEQFEWLVDGLLSVGGVSIIAGDPKAGKSTLIRQLARCISRGERFLDRKVKTGLVLYTALEEQRALLKDQFKALGVTGEDNIRIHVGSPLSRAILETLEDELMDNQVKLLVIDTFLLGLRIKEPNSYAEVNEALTPFRDLARDSGTHIMFVHHTNKSGMGSNAISGSKAIHGAVDCAMIMQSMGKKRLFTTNGRGVRPFYNHELIFHSKNQTYELGEPGGFNEDRDNNF